MDNLISMGRLGLGSRSKPIQQAFVPNIGSYLVSPGTQLENFDNTSQWTLSGGSIEQSNLHTGGGTGSFLTTGITGSFITMTKTISDFVPANKRFVFRVYLPDHTKAANIHIQFSSTTNFSKYIYKAFGSADWATGENTFVVEADDWSAIGDQTSADTMIRVRFRLGSQTGQICTGYFADCRYDYQTRPKVVFIFDDNELSQYTVAYPYMEQYGYKGVIGVVGDWVGDAGRCTLANLQEMYADGWDMINHTYNHTNLTTIGTQAEMESEIEQNRIYLVDNGMPKAANFFIFPQGGYNATALAALRARNITAARAGRQGLQPIIYGVDQPLLVRQRELNNVRTLEEAISYVDDAIASGSTLFFTAHDITDTVAQSTDFLRADFEDLIDYVHNNEASIDVVTFSDWYGIP